MRSTNVSEEVLRAKMGRDAEHFVRYVLPKLVEGGILQEMPSTGPRKRHYRLGATMQVINQAITECNGEFDAFLGQIASTR